MKGLVPLASLRELQELFAALRQFFSPAHKRQLLKVSLWACLLSFLEMTLAAVVIPYVQCLGNTCSEKVTRVAWALGLPVVPTFSVGLLVLITLKLGAKAMMTWSATSLNQQVQRDTVSQLLDGYLHLDWSSFRSRHTTHYFRRCATTAVDAAYVTQHCVTMISSTLILLFLIGLMLWKYPLASISLGVAFLGLNFLTQRLISHRQNHLAHEREVALQHWSIGMTEAFASFREIRVYALERFFLNHLDRPIQKLVYANKRLNFLPTLPHLILDFAVLGIVLTVVSIWLALKRPIGELLPQLVFYTVTARAILPAMMNLLSTRAVLFGSIVNIRLVLDELDWIGRARSPRVGIVPVSAAQGRFTLEDVTFRHGPELPPVVSGINLEIEHPSWVALVGASGAGKSTLMELLCGVHVPQTGQVVHAWPAGARPQVAYLPQHVALLDGSIADNVVFGFDAGDPARIDEVLRLACLGDFIERQPEGRDVPVGADGTRLSGGERQRLALARALYRHPDLLLLDEATSGLDEVTETHLFTNLRDKRPGMSVVYITHRSGCLRFADRVVKIDGGRLLEISPERATP